MIAGLPLGAWILLAAGVGIGLALEVAFYRAHPRNGSRSTAPDWKPDSGSSTHPDAG